MFRLESLSPPPACGWASPQYSPENKGLRLASPFYLQIESSSIRHLIISVAVDFQLFSHETLIDLARCELDTPFHDERAVLQYFARINTDHPSPSRDKKAGQWEAPHPGLNRSSLGHCMSHQLLPHSTQWALLVDHSLSLLCSFSLSGHEGVLHWNVTYSCQRGTDTSQSTAAFSPPCPSCQLSISWTHTDTHTSLLSVITEPQTDPHAATFPTAKSASCTEWDILCHFRIEFSSSISDEKWTFKDLLIT